MQNQTIQTHEETIFHPFIFLLKTHVNPTLPKSSDIEIWVLNFLFFLKKLMGVFALFNLLFLCLVSGKEVDFSEKSKLLELKNSIYDPYSMLSSWKSTSSDHCSWFGVTCDSHARVSELRIPGGKFVHSGSCLGNLRSGVERNCSSAKKGKFLGGKFSNVIGEFSELRVLSIPFNQIIGELPDEIWGLKNLQVIDIEGNLITGNLSVIGFGNLKKLQVLNLGFNRLFGEVPKSLEECEGLRILNLARNRIQGPIPGFVGSFMKLKGVYLSSNRFNGQLPDEFWSNCHFLEHVDFSGNFLHGKIPKSIRNCRKLRTLLLFSNAFDGGVPFELGTLNNLEVLDISRNKLMGDIPISFVNLTKLKAVFLNNNMLSGKIPFDFADMKSLVTFNISFNKFSEQITLDRDGLSPVPPQQRRELGSSGVNDGKKKGFSSLELVLISVASLIVLVLMVLIAVYFCMRNRRQSSRVEGIPFPSPPRLGTERLVVFREIGVPLTFDTVVQATGNFTSRNCIGSGGFGSTYRAEISPGMMTVAVKRLTVEMCQGVPQFNAEIRSLGRIRHPNLITLIGYYASASEMFLVYNYLPGGSLEEFIREKRNRVIGLKAVHKIATDAAAALAFLHDDCNPRILHRDVKPSNILLDNELKAYLSDFGLSRLLEGFESHVTTGVAGTFGYVAPEYALACRASDKADVYSYGVMLLELISDKRALDPSFSSQENGYTIVSWAKMRWQDGRMTEVFAAGMWEAGPEAVLLELLQLGLVCTAESASGRPTMKQVVMKLKQIQSAFDC